MTAAQDAGMLAADAQEMPVSQLLSVDSTVGGRINTRLAPATTV